MAKQPRTAERRFRLLVHVLDRELKGTGVEKRVRIKQDQIAAPGGLDGKVIRRTETKVDRTTNDTKIGKFLLHHLRGAVAGVIVHDKCFNPQPVHLALNQLEAFAQQVSGVERYDYDGSVVWSIVVWQQRWTSQFNGEDLQSSACPDFERDHPAQCISWHCTCIESLCGKTRS